MDLDPVEFALQPQEEQTVLVSFDGAGLADGEYPAFIHARHQTLEETSFIPVVMSTEGVPVEEEPASTLPSRFALQAPYPNPFNQVARLRFELPYKAEIRLAVYDLLGREVSILADGAMKAGVHVVTLNGGELASGVYFVRLAAAGAAVQTVKMVLLK